METTERTAAALGIFDILRGAGDDSGRSSTDVVGIEERKLGTRL